MDLNELAHEIISLINSPPFSMRMTLIQFDQLSRQALFDVLCSVLREVSPVFDFSKEAASAQAVFDALVTLGFKTQDDPFVFQEALLNGDRARVYNVLLWLLRDLSKHRMKAYLARFLQPISVPPELMLEDEYEEYKQNMEMFRQTHKELLTLREETGSVNKIREEIDQSEREKQSLISKIDKLRSRISVTNLPQLLESVAELRVQTEERSIALDQLEEQKQKLSQVKAELSRAQMRHKALLSASTQAGALGYLSQIEEEMRNRAYESEESLPQEINELKNWSAILEEVRGETDLSETYRARLQQEITQLRQTITQLIQAKAAQSKGEGKGKDELEVYRQNALAVQKNKEEKMELLKNIREQISVESAQNNTLVKKLEEVGGSRSIATSTLEEYTAVVKEKTAQMKVLKKEIDNLKAERGILTRTKELLVGRDEANVQFLLELERQGVKESQDDGSEGKSLTEISSLVNEISTKIKEQKERLAPLIQTLRQTKAKQQELFAIHSEKKKEYERLTLQLENEESSLASEAKAFREEWEREESLFHFHNSFLSTQKAKLKKSEDNTLTDKINQRLRELSQEIPLLQEQYDKVKEVSGTQQKQYEMFTGLVDILNMKLELAAKVGVEDKGRREGIADCLTFED